MKNIFILEIYIQRYSIGFIKCGSNILVHIDEKILVFGNFCVSLINLISDPTLKVISYYCIANIAHICFGKFEGFVVLVWKLFIISDTSFSYVKIFFKVNVSYYGTYNTLIPSALII